MAAKKSWRSSVRGVIARSEATKQSIVGQSKDGLLRCARNDVVGVAITTRTSSEDVLRAFVRPRRYSSNQILLADDFANPAVIPDEFLNEFMHAVLEDIIHVTVFQPVADTAGVALRGALAAIGDADLVEIAHQIAVTTGQRTRQRIVEDQKIRDQPWFQGLAIDPVISGQRRART